MPDSDRKLLIADIKRNGLIDPITLTPDGLLLDGKTRWGCCEIAGIEPRTVVYDGNDPVGFVLSKNQLRRSLSLTQRSMAVARLANLAHGSNQYSKKRLDCQSLVVHSVKELEKISGVARTYINYGRELLRSAEPNIIKMVDNDEVNILMAWEAVRTHTRAVQANWTTADVKRIGSKIVQSYKSNLPKAVRETTAEPVPPPSKHTKPVPAKPAERPYVPFKFPTAEETGMPINGTLEELQDFHDKYGRTPLHPKVFTDMSRNRMAVDSAVHAVRAPAERLADLDGLFERIDVMLAYVPDKTKKNGLEHDFAADARKALTQLEKHLPAALERLTRLADALRARKAGRARKAATTDEIRRLDTLLH
jgi:hypothetical protein